jgi:hypothetical protein
MANCLRSFLSAPTGSLRARLSASAAPAPQRGGGAGASFRVGAASEAMHPRTASLGCDGMTQFPKHVGDQYSDQGLVLDGEHRQPPRAHAQ